MATKAKVAQLSDVKAGKTIYMVYALSYRSRMERLSVISKPKTYDENVGLFIQVRNECGRVADFSLMDMGVIPNNYNQHKTFTTANAAKRYLKQVLVN